MGGEELKWHQQAHHQLMTQQGPQFSLTIQQKPMIKAHFSGRMVSSGITEVAFALVHSEKPRLRKLIMMIMIIIIITSNRKTIY